MTPPRPRDQKLHVLTKCTADGLENVKGICFQCGYQSRVFCFTCGRNTRVPNQCEIVLKNGMNKRGKFESDLNFIEINIIKAVYIQTIQDSKNIDLFATKHALYMGKTYIFGLKTSTMACTTREGKG